jgi:hypothetical protein
MYNIANGAMVMVCSPVLSVLDCHSSEISVKAVQVSQPSSSLDVAGISFCHLRSPSLSFLSALRHSHDLLNQPERN